MKLWLLILAIALLVRRFEARSKKSVVTSLHAKWSQTSFLAEASEFMAKESNTMFWNYVDLIVERINVDEWSTLSQEKQHNTALRIATSYLGDSRTDLLKFALSLRAHSPTVQLFQQLGSENPGIDCECYAEVHGRFACTVEELNAAVENVTLESAEDRTQSSTLFSLDHIYPTSKDHEITVIVYGELGTRPWLTMHNAAKSFARSEKAKYVFRHWMKDSGDDKVLLSGYGVELAIKSTEYKAMDDSKVPEKAKTDADSDADVADYEDICGFDFNTLHKAHGDMKESLDQFRLHLLEKDELTPLKVWEVQDLSFQAAQRIKSAPSEKALGLLAELSQDFPLMARSLSRQGVKKEFRAEIETNQELSLSELGLSGGENALFINGVLVDVDTLDVFYLLDLLKQEEKLADGFFRMGLDKKYVSLLADIDTTDDSSSYALDFREAQPEYLNNLDTDKQYRQWGNSVKLMLQPYFPGMIRPIARNFFTLVFVVDLSERESGYLLKIANTFYNHDIPLRLGVVFVVNDDKEVSGFDHVSVAMLNLYNFVKIDAGIPQAIKALSEVYESAKDREILSPQDVLDYFSNAYSDQDPNDVFGTDSDYSSGRSNGQAFLANSGLGNTPKVMLNGMVLDDAGIAASRFEETVIAAVMKATPKLQKAIITGKLKDRDNVMNWILSQPEVMPRINKRILDTPTSPDVLYLDLSDIKKCPMKAPNQFHRLPQAEHNQCMVERMRYLTRTEELQTRQVSLWIVADFETVEGREMAYNAIKHLKHSHALRIGFISNPTNVEAASKATSVSMLINAAMRTLPPAQMRQFVTKLVKEEIISKYIDGSLTIEDMAVNGMNVERFRKELKQLSSDEIVAGSKFAARALLIKPGERAIVANGMLVGPLSKDEIFVESDMQLLEKLMSSRGAQVITTHVEKWGLEKENDKSSDIVMRIASLVGGSATKNKRVSFTLEKEEHSVVYLQPKMNPDLRSTMEIVCVIDPLSSGGQRLSTLLTVISEVVNTEIKIIFNPRGKLSELPLKRFYRLVLQPSVDFDSSGGIITSSYQARFTSLPDKQLLTLSVIPPDSWMVQSVYAVYDLDNIKMENVQGSVVAEFQLENILLDGHCFDENSGSPPRGLQYTLGSRNNPTMYDTIVMANLGYFQLKASPGAWILRLREGRSKDLYDIANHYNTESEEEGSVHVLIDSFRGRTIRVRVNKKEGMEEENLLSEGKATSDDESQSLWSTISSTLTGGEKYDTINIFSLASGHLYERFMRIMMLSVMKHTKHPVKFWLLKNYLSPQFKKTLPILSEHYGFEYELVEYKWPRWLHHQTEKQRVMWGYKILFLDVLFPLDVRKIIFVDADQIVRTDLMELMELDLGGAPYGFTPFCDSRTSMEGFRFWKRGYWANHLAGRKYHISAIYVVDLVKFRQIAAGDRLRGQYQGLSADPNSLSNLDQDLPNNMIHQVRIKSLPQEWLWCETWCDDESKKQAKTIDMCNNPQTKEPKLEAAMRIAAEWKDYDAEIKGVLTGNKSTKPAEESKIAEEEHTHGEL